ncbi:MAG TPA: DoxX family protein [Polyangiaceae bacterium]
MNILMWILQVALAFLYLSGGGFKTFKFEELAKESPLPHGAWRALGVVEMLGAILLVVPAATGFMPELTPLAAAVLAVETLLLAAMFARKSVKLAVTNPMTWAIVMGLLALFVAYGRYALSPLT